jgi:hypothetical protein
LMQRRPRRRLVGRSYTIGCPGIAGWEYALMGLGAVAVLFLATCAYQWAFEAYEFRRRVRRAQDGD